MSKHAFLSDEWFAIVEKLIEEIAGKTKVLIEQRESWTREIVTAFETKLRHLKTAMMPVT